jgi:hypothetical protein
MRYFRAEYLKSSSITASIGASCVFCKFPTVPDCYRTVRQSARKALTWSSVQSRVAVNSEQKRLAVDELLSSETFSRSEQLRTFLSYVCERALSGHGKEINEYSVAVDALGKPADFSPGEDSSVRRTAYELRHKLQKYYEGEGREAGVRVELPKGSYTPRFVELPAAPKAAVTQDHPSVPPVPAPSRFTLVRILGAAVMVLAIIAIVFGIRAFRAPNPTLDPIVREAWRPLVASRSEVLVSVGTTLHLIVRPYMTVVAEGLPKYPAPPELYSIFRTHRPLPPGLELSMHPVDNSVQMGHAQTVVIAATTLALAGVPYQVLPERSTGAAALRGRNVILIADPQNSNVVAQRLESTPLTLEFDASAQDVVVRERAGARAAWVGTRGPDKRYREVYGLITVLPGEGEASGPHSTVIFSGITSVGTHGAAEFFSRPEPLRGLRDRFRAEGFSGFPSAYQVLVRCRSDDTLLLGAEYLTHRVIRR